MRIVIEIMPYERHRRLHGSEVAEALKTLASDFEAEELMEQPLEVGQSSLNRDDYNETTVKWRVEGWPEKRKKKPKPFSHCPAPERLPAVKHRTSICHGCGKDIDSVADLTWAKEDGTLSLDGYAYHKRCVR